MHSKGLLTSSPGRPHVPEARPHQSISAYTKRFRVLSSRHVKSLRFCKDRHVNLLYVYSMAKPMFILSIK